MASLSTEATEEELSSSSLSFILRVDPAQMTTAFAEIKVTATDGEGNSLGEDSIKAKFLPSLAVDANRDGRMSFTDHEIRDADWTGQWWPYRFWVNDDDDFFIGRGGDETGDAVPVRKKDWDDPGVIDGRRDLEDFARLWIDVRGLQMGLTTGSFKIGLKWKDPSNANPTINIYRSADKSGSDSYLKSDVAALAQMQNGYVSKSVTLSGNTTAILPPEVWQGLTPTTPASCFIYELVSEGRGELQIILLDSQDRELGGGTGLWVESLNVKKMYIRAKGTPPEGIPTPHKSFSQPNPTPTWFARDEKNGEAFLAPGDEENSAVIYVHGIHGPGQAGAPAYLNTIKDAETVFKRLWHQGFKGRFGLYKWPALTPGPGLQGLTGFEYNNSEYRAWKYGRGLAGFVNSINKSSKNLFAHSQGNIVCGAALTDHGLSVDNYVLTQAAVPAGCYDTSGGQGNSTSINGYARFWNKEANWPTPDDSADLGYRGYLNPINVSGQVVNFFNSDDGALGAGADSPWELNQDIYKPNNITSIRSYAYNKGPQGQPFPVGARCFLRALSFGVPQERAVLDIHESMSFIARPRSRAVGARVSVGGSVDAELNLADAPLAFSPSVDDHGAQVARRIQQLWPYYQRLNGLFQEE